MVLRKQSYLVLNEVLMLVISTLIVLPFGITSAENQNTCLFSIQDSLPLKSKQHKGEGNVIEQNARIFMPHIDANQVRTKNQNRWIRQQIKQYTRGKRFSDEPSGEFVTYELPDYQKISLRIQTETRINFADHTTALLIPHSSHKDPKIGDVTLLITEKGKVYFNRGHVCGGIVHFEFEENISIPTLEQFIHFFYSDTDQMYFEEYK